MSKKDKIFIIWIAIFIPLSVLCGISGGIIICFNEQVGLTLCWSSIYVILLCVMVPYIIWLIGKLIKLMKDED